MPGKVNPVMCESLMQVASRVMGNDETIAVSGAAGGQFQLNIMMPVMAHAVLESMQLMASGCQAFVDFCAAELEANSERCEAAVEESLSMVTSLNPHIGYEKAAAIAKKAFASGKTVRELVRQEGILPDATLREALDPWRMTGPQE
jgi:fumarate hydratase class II